MVFVYPQVAFLLMVFILVRVLMILMRQDQALGAPTDRTDGSRSNSLGRGNPEAASSSAQSIEWADDDDYCDEYNPYDPASAAYEWSFYDD